MHVNVVNAVGDGKKLKERKSSVASRIHGEKSVRAKMAVRAELPGQRWGGFLPTYF